MTAKYQDRKPKQLPGVFQGQTTPPAQHASTTGDIDYTDAQVEFMLEMQRYKEEKHRPFPTWCEVLAVLTSLGYRKVI